MRLASRMPGNFALAGAAARSYPDCASRTPPTEYRRLVACASLALAIHLLAFGLIKPGFAPAPIAVPSRVLQWVFPAEPEPAAASASSAERPARIAHRGRSDPGAPSRSDAEPANTEKPSATVRAVPLPNRGAAELIESARAIARETGREHETRPSDNGMQTDRPLLPALDRKLTRPKAGEDRRADGLTCITTASGQAYCLQPPPDFARGGPAEATSIPQLLISAPR